MYRGSSFTVNVHIEKSFLKGNLNATLFNNDVFARLKPTLQLTMLLAKPLIMSISTHRQ